jgi:hypothetical protein
MSQRYNDSTHDPLCETILKNGDDVIGRGNVTGGDSHAEDPQARLWRGWLLLACSGWFVTVVDFRAKFVHRNFNYGSNLVGLWYGYAEE